MLVSKPFTFVRSDMDKKVKFLYIDHFDAQTSRLKDPKHNISIKIATKVS